MQNLHITNAHFITFTNELFIIDVLGGVDLQQVERMICTLRIAHQNYPPHRTTIDLYNDPQTDKLLRTLCDKWQLMITDISKTLHNLTLQLETYRLQELKFIGKNKIAEQALTPEQSAAAKKILQNKNLITELTAKLNTTGILGEDQNAIILFLTLASYKYQNPFSVICLAKAGIGKSYILQKISECMPPNSYSLHSRISEHALYYFDSSMLQQKALLIEDIEWTAQMLQPLATLQTQGRLTSTRATKNKDGMLHSTTFEVNANLCLVACTYNDKSIDEASLPFLCLHLNHAAQQDVLIMDYQKKIKAGLIQSYSILQTQNQLKNIIATLQNISIINPFATLINLPNDIAYPRKSLLVLLNFIEVITYFFQYQRQQIVDKSTGEIFIKTHPTDIELAFKLLKNNLFRRADELSTSARGFYNWLATFLAQANTKQFTTLDIRKAKAIHPRTLNNYLAELKLFSYLQITGGNKHRGGFIYKLTELDKQGNVQCNIENDLINTMQQIWKAYNVNGEQSKVVEEQYAVTIVDEKIITSEEINIVVEAINMIEEVEKTNVEVEKEVLNIVEKENTTAKHKRIKEKEAYTLQVLLALEAKEKGRSYLPEHFTTLTGRSYSTEARYLKLLWERKILNRQWENNKYMYTLSLSYAHQLAS